MPAPTPTASPPRGLSGGFQEVSTAEPCPVCDKPDWCSRSTDGVNAACRRADGTATPAKAGWRFIESRTDKAGAVFYAWTSKPERPERPVPRIKPNGGEKKADPDDLDLVYSALLENLGSSGVAGNLVQRGITTTQAVRIAKERKYARLDERRLKAVDRMIEAGLEKHFPHVPGMIYRTSEAGMAYWSVGRSGGILIPARDEERRIVSLKVRADRAGAGNKYFWMTSQLKKQNYNGPGPGSPLHVPLFDGDTTIVRVTEGELKADLATEYSGVLTISIPGVNSWKRAKAVCKKLGAKRVIIALDADYRTNPMVAAALANLVHDLREAGFNVAVETWPIEAGKGIDDVLIAGKADQIIVHEGDNLDGLLGEIAQATTQNAQRADALGTNSGNDIDLVCAAYNQTDVGNGQRLCERYSDRLRYVKPWRNWLHWTGQQWEIDNIGRIVWYAKKTVAAIYAEASQLQDSGDREDHANWGIKSEDLRRLSAMITMAQSEPPIPLLPETLDNDPWLFNCPNGTIDLRTGELKPHDPDDLITSLSPVEYDPDARCDRWEEFLGQVFDDHQDLIGYLQRIFGHCLTGDVSEHIILIAWGIGSNGKTTLLDIILELLGPDYAIKLAHDFLMVKRMEGHSTERMDLYRKRFAIASETGDGKRLDEALVKSLTGDGKIRGRRMREDTWEYDPTHKVILCTNHQPEIRGTDDGIWRRLALIPFTKRFWDPDKGETGPPELKADKSLGRQLRAKLSGILTWCVNGCLDWQANGLQAPEIVTAATGRYRAEQDTISGFVEDCCVAGSAYQVRASELYDAYRKWAESGGEKYVMSQRRFSKSIREKGYDRVRNNGSWYRGIATR